MASAQSLAGKLVRLLIVRQVLYGRMSVDWRIPEQPGSASSATCGRDRRAWRWRPLLLWAILLAEGCALTDQASTAVDTVMAWTATPGTSQPSLKNDAVQQAAHYKDVASKVDYSDAKGISKPTAAPDRRAYRPLTEADIRPLSLSEAVRIALENNPIIRVDSQFTSPFNPIYSDGERAASIYDVAIQSNGFSIGQRGEEAALSDFAPRLTTSMLWSRDENIQNNLFQSGGLQPGDTLYQETATFNSRLEKVFGNGASVALRGDVDYSLNNAPARLFGSVYTGVVAAEYRHPLWQGAGTDYTHIAGPIVRNSPSVLGANQGVAIARINVDISVVGFEAEVRNQIFDVNKVYWDLYQSFQQYEVQREITRGMHEIWKQVKERFDKGLEGGGRADEAQAADSYYQALANEKQALANIYLVENRLRRLLGLPAVDGKILRPTDVPQTLHWDVDWEAILLQALANRLELRKQKLAVRSLQLQLQAACSLINPRADFVAQYRVNAFGDQLWTRSDNDVAMTPSGLRSAVGTLVQGDQTGWNLGFEVAVPLGFLQERAQVRQLEWRLAKAMTVLSSMEMEIQYELRLAVIDLQRWHANLQDTGQRKDAAARRVTAFRKEFELGRKPADLLLRAQISSGEAQVAYLAALVEYNKAIAHLAYRTESILAQHSVRIMEGTPPQVLADAQMLISTENEGPGVFDRISEWPIVSRWFRRSATWTEKSEAVLRQSMPAAYFPPPVSKPNTNDAPQAVTGPAAVNEVPGRPANLIPPPNAAAARVLDAFAADGKQAH